MLSLRSFGIAALAACSIAPVFASQTPAQVVGNIQMLTQKSQALQVPAQNITIVNGPLIIIGLGPFPQIIAGFSDIAYSATAAISRMQGSPSVSAGSDADSIFDAFREFVRVHQQLLNILIGKAGLFSTVPFIGQPVAAALRQIENVVDTIAFGLIDMVQSRSMDLQNQATSLNGTLIIAIQKYEGLSVPGCSPLAPSAPVVPSVPSLP